MQDVYMDLADFDARLKKNTIGRPISEKGDSSEDDE
jgi:hypothetical protein